jgi:L-fuculose-phosphate aldolase
VAFVVPPLVHMPARGHLQRVVLSDAYRAGSVELAEDVMRRFGDGTLRAALMREHGSITVGPDLRSAHARTEYLEDNCRVALIAAQVVAAAPGDTLRLAEGNLAE